MPSQTTLQDTKSEKQFARRLIGALLNASLWGMVVALAFNRWTWLEMRFNIGWIFFGVWLALFAILMWRTQKPLGFAFSTVNAVACTILCILLCGGLTQVQMLPACLIRESLRQTQWSIATLDIAILAFIVICLMAIGALELFQHGRTANGTP